MIILKQYAQEQYKEVNIMTKNEIIEYIAKNRMVEEIVKNIAGTADEDLKDLIQDIYEDLFTKEEKLLRKLYEEEMLRFFITRIVFNNIHSKTSRYYMTYKKQNKNKVNIEELYDKY